jgi:hypothetical protein
MKAKNKAKKAMPLAESKYLDLLDDSDVRHWFNYE